jgi:hypothetical protein
VSEPHRTIGVVTVAAPETPEEIRKALRADRGYYAEEVLKVVDEDGEIVPLRPRLAQRRLYAALAQQRAAGLPQRAIVLKSRKVGISTATSGLILQELLWHKNRRGVIVAQDHETAGELFDIADTMYAELPADPEIKPPLASRTTSRGGAKTLKWGERSRLEQERGNKGHNSTLKIDTASEVQAGRGKTIAYLHCSEVAFWPDKKKMTSLLNAVPERPGTVVILESTANGHNFFKKRWDRAERGQGGFTPVFIGWLEDENCVRPFTDPDERARFIETIGTGDYGADEQTLRDDFGATPEQLNFRRYAIDDKCDGEIATFKQEYPTFAQEAFVGSGKHVFSVVFMERAKRRAEAIEQLPPEKGGPQLGVLQATETKERRVGGDTFEVPTKAMWVPSEATGFPHTFDFWTRWLASGALLKQAYERGEITAEQLEAGLDPEETIDERAGQFIVSVDPAGGEENTTGDEDAYHGIQVIDHRTHEQVAELQTRNLDHDQLADQAFLAALFFNAALITVETTGGYGTPVARRLWDKLGWRRMYKRKRLEQAGDKTSNVLGFDTNRTTKPMMIAGLTEMLREGTHGIRSRRLVLQLTTYIYDEKTGKARPDDEAFADLLTAYMQGQEVARQTPLRPDGSGQGPVNTWTGVRY